MLVICGIVFLLRVFRFVNSVDLILCYLIFNCVLLLIVDLLQAC